MIAAPLQLIQGTLDLLILRTLARRPMHGYAIAIAISDRTGGELAIEDAALYQALHRLHRQSLIQAEWRPSMNNRRARYYALTPAGRRSLRQETSHWRRYTRAVDAVLEGV